MSACYSLIAHALCVRQAAANVYEWHTVLTVQSPFASVFLPMQPCVCLCVCVFMCVSVCVCVHTGPASQHSTDRW